jgi:hypothetical protein
MTERLDAIPDFLSEPSFLPRITQHDGRAIEEALAASLFDTGVRLCGTGASAAFLRPLVAWLEAVALRLSRVNLREALELYFEEAPESAFD